ncbi:MAG TPA: DUF4157 domain-containing protein [Kofleriaceae bacterium]|nr:DUF4157 domain-containing protein [Kofleriaceae bacterium]
MAAGRASPLPTAWLAGGDGAAAESEGPAGAGGPEMSSDVSFVDSLVGGDQSRPLGQAAAWGPRLGVDLSGVRVHSGPDAAARVGEHDDARAYAEGTDIFLGEDEREDDLDLMGHEVAHVAQAAHGQIAGPHAKREGDTSAIEQEADRAGHALVHGEGAVRVSAIGPGMYFGKKKKNKKKGKKDETPKAPQESPTAGAVRIALRQLAAEAAQLGSEMNKLDDTKAMVPRAMGALSRILASVSDIVSLAEMMTPEEQKAQRASAAFLLDRCAQIKSGRPEANLIYTTIKSQLEKMVGSGLKVTEARRETTSTEALEVLEASLHEAELVLAGAVGNSQPGQKSAEPESPLGLGKLAAATLMLRRGAVGSDDVAEREKLQPLVKKLVKHTKVLQTRHGKSESVRELRVRVSDICEQVYLDRLVDDGMEDILTAEVAGVRGYTEEQAARFEAAAKLWQKTLETQFEYQKAAVDEVWQESLVVDPPKKPPLWKTLALNALKAATGGAAGFIIDMGADYAMGDDDALKGRTGTKGIKSVLGDVVKSVATTLIDEAIDYVDEDEPMKGGGDAGAAAAGGGGRSTDAKTAFFAGQYQTLITAGHKAETAAIKDILAIRTTPAFAGNPEGAIKLVASGAEDVVKVQQKIMDTQRAQTRAKFAAYLVGDTYLDDAKSLDVANHLNGQMFVENTHNVAGMVSMQFEPGASPADPVKVLSAWIKGVNKPMRDALVEMKLGDMGVPMRARGVIPGGDLWETGIAVVVSDQGRHVAEGHRDGATEWLLAKGGGDASNEEAAMAAASRKVLDEDIGKKSLKAHGVKLGD